MSRLLERWDESRDGPFSETAMRTRLEGRGYLVSRYVYPPGTRFPPHDHSMDKVDGVVAGRFRMTLAGGALILEAGDMLEIPAGVLHSAEVVGDVPVVSLDAVAGA